MTSARCGVVTAFLMVTFALELAVAEPGEVLRAREDGTVSPSTIAERLPSLFEDARLPSPHFRVDVYQIDYETTDLAGRPSPTRLQLFVPRIPRRGDVPFYVFAPGSTGLVDACRPSREHVVGVDWGLYRTHALAHASQGTIVAVPDYMSFHVAGEIQPYFIATAEARVLLDAVRATRRFLAESSYRAQPYRGTFLAGYSQGGHAVFAAADLQGEYAPDVEIGGIIGYGPSTNVENLLREWTVAAPLLAYAYATYYDAFDPGLILQDRWLENLSVDATRQCIGAVQAYYPTEAGPLYRPEFARALYDGTLEVDYPSIAALLDRNNAGLSGHGLPALIISGTDDIVVYPESMRGFVAELCGRGSPVLHRVYEARHDTRQVGFRDTVAWMWERVTGEPVPSNCAR